MQGSDELKHGIELAKKGQWEHAGAILAQAVMDDPSSEDGWLWLGRCRSEPAQKEYCFRRVLDLNPSNAAARKELGLPVPPQQRWVRRTIYLLTGMLLGIVTGVAVVNYAIPQASWQGWADKLAVQTYREPAKQPTALAPSASNVTATPLPADQRMVQAWPLILQASSQFSQQDYNQAVLSWNQALKLVPEYGDGFFGRGASYFYLTLSQRSQSEYLTYLKLSIQDFDEAIRQNPLSYADYYQMRGRAYAALALEQPLRVDYQALSRVALENFLHGEKLPQRDYWADEDSTIVGTMVAAGECEQAITRANALLASETHPDAKLHARLSDAYYCVGDLPNALRELQVASDLAPSEMCRCDQARILYSMGRPDDALTILNESLTASPSYSGDRYYLRAVILAEQGKLDEAQSDLNTGINQTWVRGGLLSYARGKIALGRGDKQQALQYFLDAEQTYTFEGPLVKQIADDIRALGGTVPTGTAAPLQVTPLPFIIGTSTPMPIMTIYPITPAPAVPSPTP